MLYILKSALLLSVLYALFVCLLRRETFHRLNRVVLLSTLCLSILIPALRLRMAKPSCLTFAEEEMPLSGVVFQNVEPVIMDGQMAGPDSETLRPASVTQQKETEHARLFTPLNIYLLGFVISVLVLAARFFMVVGILRRGMHLRDSQGNTIIICNGRFAPCSFFRHILVSAADYDRERDSILLHEQAHARFGHSWDILLLQVVQAIQWFNPVVRLLGRDLRAVHEYEADEAVLKQGIDATRYQILLLTQASGGRLQTFANGLWHGSIKNRIVMMHKEKTSRGHILKAIFLLPVLAIAIVAFAKTPLQALPEAAPETAPASYARQMEASKERAASAFIISLDEKNPVLRRRGNLYILHWLAGTWVETNDGSFVEDHPERNIALPADKVKMQLDGVPFDLDHIPDIPASAVRKMERRLEGDGRGTVNLVTKPVQIPAGVKGNINPEFSLLLTGVVPKGSYWRTSIYVKPGRNLSFDWRTFHSYTTWEGEHENVRNHLRDVAIRKDHHVYVNVTREGERHVRRIEEIMKECGVTNYEIIRQQ